VEIATMIITARELALRAFWTEHALCRLYAETMESDRWSIRQLIMFAETLPPDLLAELQCQ
jgi:hypothetical protein